MSTLLLSAVLFHCSKKGVTPGLPVIEPVIVTEPVKYDTDDPAIWVNPDDPGASLIIGTDKEADGGLYVYDLQGKIVSEKCIHSLQRPNNVDVEYGLMLNGAPVDIAVTTERLANKIRVFTLPDMQVVDGGGIEVFVGEALRAPMGIALYKRPADGAIFAVVGRKDGPKDGRYLWQYRLYDDGNGQVKADKVREFGRYSGIKEIEAIAVDDELGYVYYSDEGVGVRKYPADPDAPAANEELALFARDGFADDHEGISIYKVDDKTGYILVSDQGADEFHIYKREGEPGQPHHHPLVKVVRLSTQESDGSDVVSIPLNDRFPQGLFVAMSTDRTFHFYSWTDIAGEELLSHDGNTN
ncbi:phytase [candidate division KSB1 bacterium]|nr:phytase [candidate division KSB1 bacterium]